MPVLRPFLPLLPWMLILLWTALLLPLFLLLQFPFIGLLNTFLCILNLGGMLTVKSLVQPNNELGFFFAAFPLSPILLPLNVLRLLLTILDASLSVLAGVSLSLLFL